MLQTYKLQAKRLHSFLLGHPEAAIRLAEAKHSACLEAVAAVHGARNWNTLQGALPEHLDTELHASASSSPAGRPDTDPI